MGNTTLKTIGNRPQNEKYPYDVFNVGDKCHVSGYSDINPATVVAVQRNGSSVTVRYDSAKLKDGQKPNIVSGGFAGHCTNQHELEWDILDNPEGAQETFTLRKWRGRYVWTSKNSSPDGKQQLRQGWRKFYDYNF